MRRNNDPADARGAALNGGAQIYATRKFPALSRRLAAVADAVRVGARLADVGCDHGKLAAYLVSSGKCPSAVATDINEAPLEKARALFASPGLEGRCRAVLCDGLDGLEPNAADDVAISGLGADVIIDIISRAEWLKNNGVRLLLCPSTRHAMLRAALYEAGFALMSERAVSEGGYCYAIMSARYTARSVKISDGFAAIGLLTGESAEEKAYRAREIKRLERLLRSGAEDNKKRRAQSALEYIREVERK